MKKYLQPIAIVGIGAIMPGASNKDKYWENIENEKSSIGEIPKDRWDWRLFYDPDPAAEDKTYSKIGGFIRDFEFDPIKHRIPPKIAAEMDTVQHLAIETSSMALEDAGYNKKPFDKRNTAVIIGNSMGGMKKEMTDAKVNRVILYDMLRKSPTFESIADKGNDLIADLEKRFKTDFGRITEDTMPGELSNVIAGRVANVLDVNGANFAVDAACATSLAALYQAVNGLRLGMFNMAVCGGVDQMMSASAYVKFCKIGALSPDGSYVFDKRANGFVMAEGCGMVVVKRLSDAIADGDKIYALIRAIGASSDGRGKGITAPNPKGQKIAIENTFEQLDYTPADIDLIEAHGTATSVGDAAELIVLDEFFKPHKSKNSLGITSVKSNIGHSKAAAGIASVIKTALAMHKKILPPSINFETPNPKLDWNNTPLRVITKAEKWDRQPDKPRRANVSSFGFGGTNFHAALEEYDPGISYSIEPRYAQSQVSCENKPILTVKGEKLQSEAVSVCADTKSELFSKLNKFARQFDKDKYPAILNTYDYNVSSPRFYGVTFTADSAFKIKEKVNFFIKVSQKEDVWHNPSIYLKMKGIYPFNAGVRRGKVGFMFPGQGSQYVDMMKDLANKYQVVKDTFEHADKVLKKLINTTLTEVIWSGEGETAEELAKREEAIKQTQMTQPAVLTADYAMMRLLASFGVKPDVVVGHSLGEYAAAVASGIFTFENGLRAVTNRAKEMSNIKVDDPGKMISVAAPCEKVEAELKKIKGYVAAANKNCPTQTVIAGETKSAYEAMKLFNSLGMQAVEIPVSHAFHSKIMVPAVKPYSEFLSKIPVSFPKLPIVSNVTADFYPNDESGIRDLLVRQITSTVEWIRQLEKMYELGVRLFVECGPKRVLSAFATSSFQNKKDIRIISSNHPKRGGILEFNDLLANLMAGGVNIDWEDKHPLRNTTVYTCAYTNWVASGGEEAVSAPVAKPPTETVKNVSQCCPEYEKFGFNINPIAISGISAGVPGSWDRVFRETGIDEILKGQNLIEPVSKEDQQKQIDKNIEHVIKSADGNHRVEKLKSIEHAVKLAAKKGGFDLEREFGLPHNWVQSMDITFRLSIAAGILALKDANIPLVMHYKKTSTGSYLPDGWGLPAEMMDSTGVIYASAFPNMDTIVDEVSRYFTYKMQGKSYEEIHSAYDELIQKLHDPQDRRKLTQWFGENFKKYATDKRQVYALTREFILKIIPAGHAQFCQWIRARGPATHTSAACATTANAICIAEDWIRTARAKRVIVIAADDVTNENLQEWVLSALLASGAATKSAVVSEAALPFDKRRHGMIAGMAAVGLVVEDETETKKRGIKPLARILSTATANSAFHPTRLDVNHVADIMENLMSKAEKVTGLDRHEIAKSMLFMSHETYTPARGGSASAEVNALKKTFGPSVGNIIVSNVKGFTGHTMGAGIEDVVAVRALNTGTVPPIANYKVPDPELSGINLSKGGQYDLKYALRLAAGFGSQNAMTLTERTFKAGESRTEEDKYQNWLKQISNQQTPHIEVVKNTLRVKDIGISKGAKPPVVVDAPQAFVKSQVQKKPIDVSEKVEPERKSIKKPSTIEGSTVKSEILKMIAEKTGYPEDMLDIDLDMEADLGIDTVKQAELFAAIREHYNIEQKEGLQLKDYPTIRHCVKFVTDELGNKTGKKIEIIEKPQKQSAEEKPAKKPETSANEEELKVTILKMISEKTGYPEDMLDIDLDMEADLGIDTVKQAELFAAIREHYNIEQKEGLQLKDYPTIRHCIKFVTDELGGVETKKSSVTEQPAKTKLPANEEELKVTILKMIAEKTGYPEDMLDIDLDMEADLGIDTVKQAELFAAIREHYNIEQKEGLQLKDYPTIRHCVKFVVENIGGSSATVATTKVQTQPEKKESTIKYTKNIRNIPFLVEAPLTSKVARRLSESRPVIIFSDNAELTKAYREELEKIDVPIHIFTSLKSKAKDTTTVNFEDLKDVENKLEAFSGENPKISGIVYLLGVISKKLDTSVSPHNDLTKYALPLFVACKIFLPDLKDQEICDTFVAVNTTLDGGFGFKTKNGFDPVYGALSGMMLCLRKDLHELTKTLTKLLDFAQDEKPQTIAKKTIGEITGGDTKAAICFLKDKRMTYNFAPTELDKSKAHYDLRGKTILVTGAGRGLGAMFSKIIAERYKTNLVMLDIVETDDKTPQYAKLNSEELKELEKNIWQEMKSDTTKKSTPLMLKHRMTQIKDAVELYDNIQHLKKLKIKVDYHCCDITDRNKFMQLLGSIKSKHGNIDGVVHFAGLERSKLLGEKTIEEFYKVFDVKAQSAMDMVSSSLVKEDGFWVFMSSIAGKFGNIGQSDYAAASDYISKLAVSLNNTGIRAVAFDMSAYADIGMAIRPGVMAFLKSQGLDFIDPIQGMQTVIDEIVYGRDPEIVLTSRLGKLDWDNQLKAEGEKASGISQTDYHFVEKIQNLEKGRKLLATKVFSLESDPYLADHSINGKPYVPGVMGIETFMEAGSILTGRNINLLKEVRFALPIKLIRNKPIEIRIKSDSEKIELESDFIGPKGIKLNTRTHFTCKLTEDISLPDWDISPPDKGEFKSYEITREDIYKKFFHGPSFQVLGGICKITDREVFAVYRKPSAPLWEKDKKLLAHPMMVEAAFQTCGYRDLYIAGRTTLPDFIEEIVVSPDDNPSGKVYVWARFKQTRENKSVYDAYVFDDKGKLWVKLKDYYMIG